MKKRALIIGKLDRVEALKAKLIEIGYFVEVRENPEPKEFLPSDCDIQWELVENILEIDSCTASHAFDALRYVPVAKDITNSELPSQTPSHQISCRKYR